jgi:hypothetical protein
MTRLRHIYLAIKLLPVLFIHHQARSWLGEMRQFCRELPAVLKQPLPLALAQIEPPANHITLAEPSEQRMRELADLAALLERRSPLGLCLRRSLVRYHFLRPLGVPVVIQFGARLLGEEADRDLAGHAWLSCNGRPYHEAEENWRNFTVMLRWPADPV